MSSNVTSNTRIIHGTHLRRSTIKVKKKCMGFGWYILKVQLLNSPKKVKSKFLCDSLMGKLVFKIRPFSALFFLLYFSGKIHIY